MADPNSQLTSYQHKWADGTAIDLPLGKVVCVGRNYAKHAAELNNPVPTEPILFIKPASSVTAFADGIALPGFGGSCHYETELALLIGAELRQAAVEQALDAVMGVGLALDLTLRELQSQLKDKGLPWEKSKAFDGSCPLSPFVGADQVVDWNQLALVMTRNGNECQRGISADMLTPVAELLAYTSQFFTLQPGDVVLTGTPEGVGQLAAGDQINAEITGLLQATTHVK